MKKYERFAKQFRIERERHNFSQEKVAEKLNVGSKTIKRWESGENLPQPEFRSRICELFEKTPQEMGIIEAVIEADTTSFSSFGELPHVGNFYGRTKELTDLQQWIVHENCRIIAIVGMGGIGKTSLVAKLAEQVRETFEYIFWYSLQNVPPLEDILKNCVGSISGQQHINFPSEIEDQIVTLIRYLQVHRCLLVFDNFESLLQATQRTSQYQEGYESYSKLLHRLGDLPHRSCLILTSREKPEEITRLEGRTAPVRSLPLSGVGQAEGQKILADKDLFGSHEEWSTLIHLYSGNPLALKLIAESIRMLFGGNIASFLATEEIVFGYVHNLLEQQFQRLSAPEQQIMYWLAIEREAVSLHELRENIITSMPKGTLFDAVESLRRRLMIEFDGSGRFSLQPAIMEYTTKRFIEQICAEIHSNTMKLLDSHALIKAQAKDYVRESQIRFILAVIAESLYYKLGNVESEKKLKALLASLHTYSAQKVSYAAGNILNLCIQLQMNLREADLSHLVVRQAYLQGVDLPEVNFAHSNLRTSVFAHNFSSVLCVAFSPKGDMVAGGTTTGEVYLWRAHNATPLFICTEHKDGIRSVAFSPDGNLLASGSEDQRVHIWDTSTGRLLRVLEGHESLVRSVSFSPDGQTLASASEDQTVRLWECRTGNCRAILTGHTNWVRSAVFSPDGQTLVSASEDLTIRCWDTTNGDCRSILRGHTKPIRTVAFSPNGRTIASGGDDQTIRLWDAASGHMLNTLRGHTDHVRSICFTANGNIIASSSSDQTIRLWDANSGHTLNTLRGHTNRVWSIAFSPDDRVLVSTSDDQTVRFWEARTGLCLRTLQGHTNLIKSIAFSADSQTLACGSEDQTIRLWRVDTGQHTKTLRGHTSRVRTVAFSPNGTMIASGSEDETVRLWDADTGQNLKTLRGHTHLVRSVAFSHDGSILASGSQDQTVRLWDAATGRCLMVLREHPSLIWGVAFSPHSKMLASSGEDKIIQLWDVATGQPLSTLNGHAHRVWSVAFSPDGSKIVSSGDDQSIRLWDINTGQCLVMYGHSHWIRCVAFSPDGNFIASGSHDQTVRLWSAATGQCLKTFYGHKSCVWSVDFAFDGSLIASGSDDGTIKLWNIHTGLCLKTLRSERLYEGMNIADAEGLTEAQKTTLIALGAITKHPNLP